MGSYSQYALQEIDWDFAAGPENWSQGDAIFSVEATMTVAFHPALNNTNLVRVQRLIVDRRH